MSKEFDSELISESEYPFRETLRWWERRRIFYNVVVVILQVIIAWEVVVARSEIDSTLIVLFSGFFLLIANLCYCLGWGIEFLVAYYFKSIQIREGLRAVLFIFGLLFSLYATIVSYNELFWNGAYFVE